MRIKSKIDVITNSSSEVFIFRSDLKNKSKNIIIFTGNEKLYRLGNKN